MTDDVTFTGGSAPITTSLNLHLNGELFPRALTTNSAVADITSKIDITVGITQGTQSYTFEGSASEAYSETGDRSSEGSIGSVSTSGLLTDFFTGIGSPSFPGDLTGNSDLTTGLFTVQPGIPVNVSLTFSADTVTSGSVVAGTATSNPGDAILNSTTNFIDTLSFATDMPVFTLSDADTVNSIEANIVNDQYSPVPEPSTFFLLGTGLVGFVLMRRRRA